MKSQWDCIRKNLGEWHGSFTQFSSHGDELRDVPSLLKLEETSAGVIRLVLIRTPPGESASEMQRTFTQPGPGPTVPFFDTGAFAQGSTFWSSHSRNGAELALTTPERRVRLVMMYAGLGGRSRLSDVTLIRETQAGSQASESSALTVAQLLGTWEGEGVSILPDGRIFEGVKSQLVVERRGDRLEQSLRFDEGNGSSDILRSKAHIDGCRLLFEDGPFPVQLLMLPGGASANGPLEFPSGQAFFLEAGWMVEPGVRQRLIRRYDSRGDCQGVTLIRERQVS